jgi:multidrug resistance efflux pump
MKLHQRKSYLVSQDEGRPQRRKWPRLTQILYILFILFVFLYVIYFFLARSFYVKTDGIIEVAKQRIAATHGGKIEQFTLSQGDRFKVGDKLAVIGSARFCSPPAPDMLPAKLTFNIKDEEIELKGLQKEIALLQRIQAQPRQANAGIRRALELKAPLLQNPQAESIKILEKQNEIDIQRLRISNLYERLRLYKSAAVSVNNDPRCSAETLSAPFDGYVFSTTFAENEVSSRGETIMTIVADTAEVNIEIYLDNDLFDSAQPQQSFDIILPNGTTSQAVVSEIFSSAITQAEREWNDYKPVIPQLKAHLVPVDPNDIDMWKQYDRYRVNVKGIK